MNIIRIILLYLTIGVSITWLYDYILQKTQPSDKQFDNLERLVVTLVWPLVLIHSIISITKPKNGKSD